MSLDDIERVLLDCDLIMFFCRLKRICFDSAQPDESSMAHKTLSGP